MTENEEMKLSKLSVMIFPVFSLAKGVRAEQALVPSAYGACGQVVSLGGFTGLRFTWQAQHFC